MVIFMYKIIPKTLQGKYCTLPDLFEAWKHSHLEDADCPLITEETFSLNLTKEHAGRFCPDGKLGNETSKTRILFICRESNVGNTDKEEKTDKPDIFWMKNVVSKKGNDRRSYYGDNLNANEKRAQTKYYNCILAIASGKTIQKEQNPACLNACAYMNLNKRGGGSCCNASKLENYFILYQNYILEEIKIINPEYIVILGKLSPKITDSIKNNGWQVHTYPFHPSVYSKDSIKETIKKLPK